VSTDSTQNLATINSEIIGNKNNKQTTTQTKTSINTKLTKKEMIALKKKELKAKKQKREEEIPLIHAQSTHKEDKNLIHGYDIGHSFTQDELKDLFYELYPQDLRIFQDIRDQINIQYNWFEGRLEIYFDYDGKTYSYILYNQDQARKHDELNSGITGQTLSKGLIHITEDNTDELNDNYTIFYNEGNVYLYKQDGINDEIPKLYPTFNLEDEALKKCILKKLKLPLNATPTREQILSILYLECRNINSLAGLESWDNLKGIKFQGNPPHNLSILKELDSLELLILNGHKFSVDAKQIGQITQLETLEIQNITVDNSIELNKLVNLETISLKANNIDNLAFLSPLTKLFDLKIEDNQIKLEHQKNKLPPAISQVILINLGLTSLNLLDDLNYLQILNVNHNQIKTIENTVNLEGLDSLEANYNQLSDITFLKNSPRLQTLELTDNLISDILFFEDLKDLRQINLKRNNIIDFPNFDKHYSLDTFDVTGNPDIDCSQFLSLLDNNVDLSCDWELPKNDTLF